MKSVLFILLLLVGSFPSKAQSSDLQQYYAQAIDARDKGDATKFYEYILKALDLHPYHQGILYQAGIAAALNDKKTEAINYLKEALLIQSDFVIDIPELKSLKSSPEFIKLNEIKNNAAKMIISADTAFVIKDRSLHLESVVASKEDFYGGSVHKRKIIKVKNGAVSDFTKAGQDGLPSVFGVKADEKKNILWASCSPIEEMENFDARIPSSVVKYDLKTGKLIKKYEPENPSMQLVLGELTLNKKGNVFVSDSKTNLIFKVDESSGKLQQFYSSEEFWNIQGITFSDDDNYLFIADYVKGIFRLSIKDLKLTHLTRNFDLSLKGIDGLYFYHNSLIAIQNGIKPMRVTRYQLNPEQDKLISYAILDQGHPAFNEPTLGSIYNNTFYYVANSQWSGYDKEHHIKPGNVLQDIVVLKVELKK
jgi:hypothetical protein